MADATVAEWMIESQQDMPVIVASVMALHGRLMSALREVRRLREVQANRTPRVVQSVEDALKRARTPAPTPEPPEIPFAAQREAELRATERPAPRPTR